MTAYIQNRKTGQFVGSIGTGKANVPTPAGTRTLTFSHAPKEPPLPKIRWTEQTRNEYCTQIHAILAGTNLQYGYKTRDDVTRKISEGIPQFKIAHPYGSYKLIRLDNGTYKMARYYKPFAPDVILQLDSKITKLNESLPQH